MAVDMSSISVVLTAARLAPRIKPSESLWFATSWRLPLSEIFLTLLCTLNMYFQSYMPSCTTVCRAPFTPKWSGTDPARPERTGKIISVENIFKTFREINFTSFLAFIILPLSKFHDLFIFSFPELHLHDILWKSQWTIKDKKLQGVPKTYGVLWKKIE